MRDKDHCGTSSSWCSKITEQTLSMEQDYGTIDSCLSIIFVWFVPQLDTWYKCMHRCRKMILIMGACPKWIIFRLHNKPQVLLLHLTVHLHNYYAFLLYKYKIPWGHEPMEFYPWGPVPPWPPCFLRHWYEYINNWVLYYNSVF